MGIKIGCGNPYLKRQLKTLFRKIGISVIEKGDGLSIRSLQEIEKFREEIGFLEESKVRRGKLFKGFLKNDIVDLMILCGRISEKREWINRNFKQTEQLENFLKECVLAMKSESQLKSVLSLVGIELDKI